MATLADFQAIAAELAVDTKAIIDALTALQGKSGGIAPADLDPVLTSLKASAAALEGAATPAPAPPTSVTS